MICQRKPRGRRWQKRGDKGKKIRKYDEKASVHGVQFVGRKGLPHTIAKDVFASVQRDGGVCDWRERGKKVGHDSCVQ